MTAQLPRGVRSNNPGNIDYNPRNAWQGQLGLEQGVAKPRFARFDTPENGIRALGKLLLTYQRKHGLKTVKAIISRWAPAVENDTAAYVRAVEANTGTRPGRRSTWPRPRSWPDSSRRSSITRMLGMPIRIRFWPKACGGR